MCVLVINRLDSFSFFWLKNDCRPTKPILHLWESWRRSWHCWKRLSRSFKLHSVASVDWNLFMQHIPRFWAKGQHLGLDFVNTTNNANPFLFSLYLCFPSRNTHLYFNFYLKIFKYLMYSNQQKSIKIKKKGEKVYPAWSTPPSSGCVVFLPDLTSGSVSHYIINWSLLNSLRFSIFTFSSYFQRIKPSELGSDRSLQGGDVYEIINVTHFTCHNQFTTCFQNLFLSFLH